MLNIVYLLSIILGVSGQSIVKKPYTQKLGGRGVYLFSAMMSATALLFFVAASPRLQFNTSFLPYSIGFAAAYATSSLFMVLAIAHGSLALSSLFVSYSLMIPTLYGLIFLGDPISAEFLVGLALLAVSLFLVNKTDKKETVSLKWLLFATLSFIGNGMCTVVQKMQQLQSGGAYKSEFMIVALGIVCIVMLILSLTCERRDVIPCAKSGWYLAVLCGLLNGLVNLFTMILSARMPVALMFPLISVGGLLVTYLVSKFFYKEPLTKAQTGGFLLGLAAVILLSI